LKVALSWLKKGAQNFGLKLSDEVLEQFGAYMELLRAWNRRHNLTSLRTEEEIAIKHFLDSLAGFLIFRPEDKDVVLDLGSGAGFPGVPLKLCGGKWSLSLLEPRLHASNFLRELLFSLKLEAQVIRERAETACRGDLREGCNWVVSRAVARLNQLAELGLPLLAPSGCLLAWKQEEVKEEIEEAERALRELGGELEKVFYYRLPYWELSRTLVLVRKVRPTPEKYPRRPGIPAKKPLLSQEHSIMRN
jgi:16S rRNA (guanine527-N7)-methyltransferase